MKKFLREKNKYIFGPVPSRRLGLSLGVDIVPLKTCSFDCIYCQLGRTRRKTIKRMEYVKTEEVLKELETALQNSPNPDYITFSGSGEPTLNSKLGKMISGIKKISSLPVAVLTNASRLIPNIRDDLCRADLVLPSMDAVSQEVFEKINRPYEKVRIKHIIENLKHFCKYFQGKTWLEVMLVKGVNDSREEIIRMAEVIQQINPDKIQLNTVTRPPSEPEARALNQAELERIRNIFGDKAEIIGRFEGIRHRRTGVSARNKEDDIINLLIRRPCTIRDISSSLGIPENELTKYLKEMEKDGKVKSFIHATQRHYQASVCPLL